MAFDNNAHLLLTTEVALVMDQSNICTQDHAATVPTTAFVFLALAILCFILRLYCRPNHGPATGPQQKRYHIDDYLLILPLSLSLGMAMSTIPAAKMGLGKHYQCAPEGGATWFLKSLLAWEYCYTLALTATKLSVILMYKRLFDIERFAKPFWTLFILVALWSFGTVSSVVLFIQSSNSLTPSDLCLFADVCAILCGVAGPSELCRPRNILLGDCSAKHPHRHHDSLRSCLVCSIHHVTAPSESWTLYRLLVRWSVSNKVSS